jgi:HD-like signal output (HDOD) protein
MGLSITARPSLRGQTLKCLNRLPRLSPLTSQLLARLTRRNCEIQELAEIVEKDPVLSAQILQLANAAIFARLHPVDSVRHAIAMVGLSTMRKFALGASITNLFSHTKPAKMFSLLRFNLHSVATATLVELLAEVVPFESTGDAFLAGLLHDIGKLLIAVSFPEQYDNLLGFVALTGASLIEAERDVMGIDHAELSALAISRWELSEAIQSAACYHHEPGKADQVERPRPHRAGLSLGVHYADLFVNHLGMSVLPAPLACQTASTLNIPGFAFSEEQMLLRFEKEIRNLGDLFH